MITTFKSITKDKNNMHKLKFLITEDKLESQIKSSVTIILEDTEVLPSEPLERVIEKCMEIARQEYSRR